MSDRIATMLQEAAERVPERPGHLTAVKARARRRTVRRRLQIGMTVALAAVVAAIVGVPRLTTRPPGVVVAQGTRVSVASGTLADGQRWTVTARSDGDQLCLDAVWADHTVERCQNPIDGTAALDVAAQDRAAPQPLLLGQVPADIDVVDVVLPDGATTTVTPTAVDGGRVKLVGAVFDDGTPPAFARLRTSDGQIAATFYRFNGTMEPLTVSALNGTRDSGDTPPDGALVDGAVEDQVHHAGQVAGHPVYIYPAINVRGTATTGPGVCLAVIEQPGPNTACAFGLTPPRSRSASQGVLLQKQSPDYVVGVAIDGQARVQISIGGRDVVLPVDNNMFAIGGRAERFRMSDGV